jgi:hypothetical protein
MEDRGGIEPPHDLLCRQTPFRLGYRSNRRVVGVLDASLSPADGNLNIAPCFPRSAQRLSRLKIWQERSESNRDRRFWRPPDYQLSYAPILLFSFQRSKK